MHLVVNASEPCLSHTTPLISQIQGSHVVLANPEDTAIGDVLALSHLLNWLLPHEEQHMVVHIERGQKLRLVEPVRVELGGPQVLEGLVAPPQLRPVNDRLDRLRFSWRVQQRSRVQWAYFHWVSLFDPDSRARVNWIQRAVAVAIVLFDQTQVIRELKDARHECIRATNIQILLALTAQNGAHVIVAQLFVVVGHHALLYLFVVSGQVIIDISPWIRVLNINSI